MLTWFEDNQLEVIDVSNYSPELNAIEYVWSWLNKNDKKAQQLKTRLQLEQFL